jgi:hypothetical protein
MATIVSAATGNFSAGATWVGGVVPTVGDVAQVAATHVVTIDVNTTCDAVTNPNTSGHFVLPDGVTLTANVTGGNSTAYTVQYSGTTSATIIGNITGDQGAHDAIPVRHTGSAGTLNVTGNITRTSAFNSVYGISLAANSKLSVTGNIVGSGSTSGSTRIVSAGSGVTITVNGDVSYTGSNNNYDLINIGDNCTITVNGNVINTSSSGNTIAIKATTGTITVNGNVTGSASSSGYAIDVTTATINVNGNVFGGSSSSAIRGSSTAPVTVTGDVTAGSSTGHGIVTTGLITINGNVLGGTAATAFGIDLTGSASSSNNNGRCVVNGNVTGTSGGPAINVGASALLTVNGNVSDALTGRPAIVGSGIRRISNPTTHARTVVTGAYTFSGATVLNGTAVTLVDNSTTVNEADVRDGTSYASGTKTGTLAVPPTSAVSIGVPVDNTTGTAAVTAADFATLVGAQIAAAVTAP